MKVTEIQRKLKEEEGLNKSKGSIYFLAKKLNAYKGSKNIDYEKIKEYVKKKKGNGCSNGYLDVKALGKKYKMSLAKIYTIIYMFKVRVKRSEFYNKLCVDEYDFRKAIKKYDEKKRNRRRSI